MKREFPMTRFSQFIFALAALFILSGADAASVEFNEGSNLDAAPLGTVVLTIVGSGFDSLVDAGEVGASWDETVLDYVSTAIFSDPWDTNAFDDSSNASGILDWIFVAKSVGGAGPGFNVATMTFGVIGSSGSSTTVQLDNGAFGTGWWDPFPFVPFQPVNVPVSYGSINVQVVPVPNSQVVPVPPAVWLFGSALALLGWMRRNKASKNASQ
jgi:hypothetical protein